jgi:ribosomal protein S18 acetylase RimI-like enzyme
VSTPIHLASLQPSHRSRLEIIVRATGVFAEAEIGVALELFDATDDDYEFVGAFAGGQLLGFACFGPTPSTDRTYDLYWIAVHPDAQRSGAGAALMTEVERRLAERDARIVIVETSSRPDYGPTRRFYDKRGYRESARIEDFYTPGDDRVVLTKRVAVHPPPA